MTAWRLALRDLRRGGQGLLLLAICLFLGSAALAGIGSLSTSLLAALDAQGHAALGGDLELRVSQRRATVEESAAMQALGTTSETIRLRGMARANGTPTLIDLKAVDGRWPMIGRFGLNLGALASRPSGKEIAIAPALADRLGLHVGDSVKIGDASLRVIGTVAAEPDQLGEGFRFGPFGIVDMAGLDATNLIQPGSLYEARYRLLLPPGADAHAVGNTFKRRFPNAGWSIRTAAEATGSLRRGVDQLGQFLLLVGLAALAIAGVGVGSGVGAYLAGKTRTIATLKVLGAHSSTIAAIFSLELLIVAGGGTLAGLMLGAFVPALVTAVAGASLPVAPILAFYPTPVFGAAAMSLLVTALFALPPLARARIVPAAALLRGLSAMTRRPSIAVIAAMIALLAALVALAVLTASDRMLALTFVGATGGLLLVLAAIGVLVRSLVARLPRAKSPALRLAIANLHRPGSQTDRLVLALGLGFSLFVALAVIDTCLSSEIAGAAPAKAPRFFAIDLQPDDAPRFRQAVSGAAPASRIEATPSLRGAIVALNGVRIADMKSPPDSWVLRSDRTLTWSRTLPPRNHIVAGRWWPQDYKGPPLVSLGDDVAKALSLHVGDSITIAVLGVEIPAKIANLRSIDWGGLGINFAIVFAPGYIEEAPHGLLASVYAPPGHDGAIARAVAETLPSVTLVRVGDVLGQIGELLGRIAVAIRAAAAVTVVAGIAVLMGAVAASSRARRYDAVILKLLGGSRRQILEVQALEYLALALILDVVALIVGGGGGWYVTVHIFSLPFLPNWWIVAGTLFVATIVTLFIGLLGSLPALSARPATSLRSL